MNKTLIFLFAMATLSMNAQKDRPTVQVTGQGSVMVVPDKATVRVRVEHTGKDAISVKRQNDQVVREVLTFLEGAGVASKHVMTDYIRLDKNYEYNTKTYNYSANQAITVQVIDLANYEGIMDGLLASGINRIDGIQFGSSKQKQLESEARQKAMMHAKLKATEYATALGQTIGKAVSIGEQQSYGGPQPKTAMRLASMEVADAGPTMAPGELEIVVRVFVSFELL